MTKKLNIAEMLENTPVGTKLYSLLHGEVTLEEVVPSEKFPIKTQLGLSKVTFTKHGEYLLDMKGAECVLFPSKENRDWSTFKIKPQFPTNLDDCRSINELTQFNERTLKLNYLRQLLSCRDAWWKVDNDWKPNWSEESDTWKYVIIRRKDEILATEEVVIARTLAFRTAEIRDKFLDNFRDLIEKCKELL